MEPGQGVEAMALEAVVAVVTAVARMVAGVVARREAGQGAEAMAQEVVAEATVAAAVAEARTAVEEVVQAATASGTGGSSATPRTPHPHLKPRPFTKPASHRTAPPPINIRRRHGRRAAGPSVRGARTCLRP